MLTETQDLTWQVLTLKIQLAESHMTRLQLEAKLLMQQRQTQVAAWRAALGVPDEYVYSPQTRTFVPPSAG